jgi:AcrR family transcriptional regulator
MTETSHRSNEVRKQETKQRLMDAAATVFQRKGYHKTLVSDIVAEAGVGQGTFYRYFADKREAFETLMDHFIGDLLEKFSEMSANLPTDVSEYRSASVRALHKVAETADRNREMALLFVREAPTIDHRFSEKIADFYDQFAKLAQYYLEHAIKNGFARKCRPEVVSQALVGIGVRVVDIWFNERLSGITLRELIEELVEFAFRGFGLPSQSTKNERG